MDGEDVMEVEVYKERGEHWTRGSEKEKRKRRKNTERERGVNSITVYTNSVFSRALL